MNLSIVNLFSLGLYLDKLEFVLFCLISPNSTSIPSLSESLDISEEIKQAYIAGAKAMQEEKLKNIIKEAKEKMKGNRILVEVEYSDHEYSNLEHYVLPNMENLVISFNNH